MPIRIEFNKRDVRALSEKSLTRAMTKASKKAASTSVRDMRSEANKRIRARKRLKIKDIKKAMVVKRNRGKKIGDMEWGILMKGDKMSLIKYPHSVSKKRGVSVSVNKGKRTRLPHSFVARMRTGHMAIFHRTGDDRTPIEERLGSRPVDALLHRGEAEGVRDRARKSFGATMNRVLPLELEKARKK